MHRGGSEGAQRREGARRGREGARRREGGCTCALALQISSSFLGWRPGCACKNSSNKKSYSPFRCAPRCFRDPRQLTPKQTPKQALEQTPYRGLRSSSAHAMAISFCRSETRGISRRSTPPAACATPRQALCASCESTLTCAGPGKERAALRSEIPSPGDVACAKFAMAARRVVSPRLTLRKTP